MTAQEKPHVVEMRTYDGPAVTNNPQGWDVRDTRLTKGVSKVREGLTVRAVRGCGNKMTEGEEGNNGAEKSTAGRDVTGVPMEEIARL